MGAFTCTLRTLSCPTHPDLPFTLHACDVVRELQFSTASTSAESAPRSVRCVRGHEHEESCATVSDGVVEDCRLCCVRGTGAGQPPYSRRCNAYAARHGWLRSGDTLGIETILNQHHEYRFSLKAVTHCRVLTVPRNDVSALFGADPDASKSARKLSLMRLPSDESILRRASRSLNW